MLARPFEITAAMARARGQVFALTAVAEANLRQQTAHVGGMLATHFPEFEGRPFRCFLVSAEDGHAMVQCPSATVCITTPSTYLGSAGVKAELVAHLPVSREAEAALDANGDDLEAPDVPPAGEAPGGGHASSVSGVEARLRGLFKETAGAINHRYTAAAMLSFLDLSSSLKPSAKIEHVLAASSNIFFGEEGRDLQKTLRDGEVPLPCLGTLRVARQKLDFLSMVWQQKLFLRWDLLVYQLLDASPQLGYNFLVVLEDHVRVPKSCSYDLLRRCALDLNKHWGTILLAFSSLGFGHASTVKKTVTTTNLLLMSVPTLEDCHVKRKAHRGQTSDHGVGHRVGDMPIGVMAGI